MRSFLTRRPAQFSTTSPREAALAELKEDETCH